MNENIDNPIQDSIDTIYAEDSAHVEDFRIRPKTISDDEVEMGVLMCIGGGEVVYYLRSSVRYSDDEDAGHEIRIERAGGEVVDEFTTDVVTASPSELRGAVQVMHDTYVQAYEDWYSYAVSADDRE